LRVMACSCAVAVVLAVWLAEDHYVSTRTQTQGVSGKFLIVPGRSTKGPTP
jgi:hypothetical protein